MNRCGPDAGVGSGGKVEVYEPVLPGLGHEGTDPLPSALIAPGYLPRETTACASFPQCRRDGEACRGEE